MSNKSPENYILLSIILTFIDLKINIPKRNRKKRRTKGKKSTLSQFTDCWHAHTQTQPSTVTSSKAAMKKTKQNFGSNKKRYTPTYERARERGKQLKPTSMRIKLRNEIIMRSTQTLQHGERRLNGSQQKCVNKITYHVKCHLI